MKAGWAGEFLMPVLFGDWLMGFAGQNLERLLLSEIISIVRPIIGDEVGHEISGTTVWFIHHSQPGHDHHVAHRIGPTSPQYR